MQYANSAHLTAPPVCW